MSDTEETVEEYNFPNRQAWQEALNAAPNDSWIKERSLGMGKKSFYMPIQYQQAL